MRRICEPYAGFGAYGLRALWMAGGRFGRAELFVSRRVVTSDVLMPCPVIDESVTSGCAPIAFQSTTLMAQVIINTRSTSSTVTLAAVLTDSPWNCVPMNLAMTRRRDDLEILNAIIEFVAVDVMDMFLSGQAATDMLFHQVAMVMDCPASTIRTPNRNKHVTERTHIDSKARLIRVRIPFHTGACNPRSAHPGTRLRAKMQRCPGGSTSLTFIRQPAVVASQVNSLVRLWSFTGRLLGQLKPAGDATCFAPRFLKSGWNCRNLTLAYTALKIDRHRDSFVIGERLIVARKACSVNVMPS